MSGGEVEEQERAAEESRKQAKELRAQIQRLKSIARSDSRRKKEVAGEIASLEAQLEACRLAPAAPTTATPTNRAFVDGSADAQVAAVRRRKQTRLDAKQARQAQLNEEAKAAAAQIPDHASAEDTMLDAQLAAARLCIYDIAPDGHCMFNALAHQLMVRNPSSASCSCEELRAKAAAYLLDHQEDYAPFLDDPEDESGDLSTRYHAYCERVRNGSVWGGQLELQALSAALQCCILVYQAGSAPLHIGQQSETAMEPLLISYHRHTYSLGEHYNSLVDSPDGP